MAEAQSLTLRTRIADAPTPVVRGRHVRRRPVGLRRGDVRARTSRPSPRKWCGSVDLTADSVWRRGRRGRSWATCSPPRNVSYRRHPSGRLPSNGRRRRDPRAIRQPRVRAAYRDSAFTFRYRSVPHMLTHHRTWDGPIKAAFDALDPPGQETLAAVLRRHLRRQQPRPRTAPSYGPATISRSSPPWR